MSCVTYELLLKISAGDRTRNVGHSLWMHAVKLMCSAGDPSNGKMELIQSVFEAMENLFEVIFSFKMNIIFLYYIIDIHYLSIIIIYWKLVT